MPSAAGVLVMPSAAEVLVMPSAAGVLVISQIAASPAASPAPFTPEGSPLCKKEKTTGTTAVRRPVMAALEPIGPIDSAR